MTGFTEQLQSKHLSDSRTILPNMLMRCLVNFYIVYVKHILSQLSYL